MLRDKEQLRFFAKGAGAAALLGAKRRRIWPKSAAAGHGLLCAWNKFLFIARCLSRRREARRHLQGHGYSDGLCFSLSVYKVGFEVVLTPAWCRAMPQEPVAEAAGHPAPSPSCSGGAAPQCGTGGA